MKRALFLDRDGVINIDTGHLYLFEDVKYVENILNIIRTFHEAEYLIIVITNQAGIAKKYYREEDVLKLHEQMKLDIFSRTGVQIDEWLYCPHKKEDNCNCRKPKSLMFDKAIKKFNINLEESFVIGDKISDMQAGYSAKIKNLFLLESRYFENNNVPSKLHVNILKDLKDFPLNKLFINKINQ